MLHTKQPSISQLHNDVSNELHNNKTSIKIESYTFQTMISQSEEKNNNNNIETDNNRRCCIEDLEKVSVIEGNDSIGINHILSFKHLIIWLCIITILITYLSNIISSCIEKAAHTMNLSGIFLAAVVLPIIGNTSEFTSSLRFALANNLDASLGITVGSSTQIALFILPSLVIISWIMNLDMSLNFGAYEISALILSVIGVVFAIKDGTSNWFLGLVMIASYIVVAIGFFAHKNDSL